MKLLFVIDNLGSGGAQNQLTLLAIALKNRGHDVTVFTYYPQDFFKERLLNAKVNIVHRIKKDKLGWSVITGLFQLVKKIKPDTVISFLDTPNFYNTLVKSLSGLNVKSIISYRSISNFEQMNPIKRGIKKWTNRKADFIVSNSEHERNRWCEKYPQLKEKFRTIYNLVNLQHFKPSGQKVKPDQHSFLVVGTVSPYKNGILIAQAFSAFKKANPAINFKVIWIGRKYLTNPNEPYFSKLDQLVQKGDLSSHWHWKEPHLNILEDYQTSNCLILASKVEGLPNVVCEALACGLPVIVSRVLDHPILVEEGKEGFQFDPDDPADLSGALEKFCTLDQAQRFQMEQAARTKAKSLFNKDRFIERYLEIIAT